MVEGRFIMSKCEFRVTLTPREVMERVKNYGEGELVHEEFHQLVGGKEIGTLVFERYFFRVSSRVALVVITDNLSGTTEVRSVSTGSSQGLFMNFDWGASGDYAYSVREALEGYVIE
jgi:hypothetical protein